MHISPADVKYLILEEQFPIIMTLCQFNVQVRLLIAKMKRATTLKKLATRMWTKQSIQSQKMPEFIEKYIKVSDFVKALIESRKFKQITMP